MTLSQPRTLGRSLLAAALLTVTIATGSHADSGDVTDDIQGFFMCTADPTCPGEVMGVWADVDGVDNGTIYDPHETMVVFYTATGYACGNITSGERTYFNTPHDTACVEPADRCSVSGDCDRGRFVLSFVDMTVAGFDQRDMATWVFTTVPRVTMELSNNGLPHAGAALPYQQAKAYKVVSGIIGDPAASADPANLIDGTSSCDAVAFAVTDCDFADPDDGIAELWVRTDYVESNIDQLVLHAPGSPGVVVLLDGSGSMSWGHDGDRSPPAGEQRIELAKRAAIEFMDQLLDLAPGALDFGIARFPQDPFDGCNASTLAAMTQVNVASHGAGVATMGPGFSTGGSTPLVAGLTQAVTLLGAHEPKAVVVLSDGYHNCPSTIEPGDPAYADLIASLGGARVFTIGFARPGDLSGHFLDELAADTVGAELGLEGFYDVTGAPGFDPAGWEPAIALASTYTKVLAAGLGLDLVADPFGQVASGGVAGHELAINRRDEQLSVHVSWTTPQPDRLDIRLIASDGSRIDTGITMHAGPTYRILSIDQAVLAQPGKVGTDPWRLEVAATGVPSGASERYQYTVVTDSAVKMRAWLDTSNPRTGDVITLMTRATEAAAPLTGLEQVEVQLTRPQDGLGNWYAANKLEPKALDKVPANLSGEQLPLLQRKAMYLTEIEKLATPGRTSAITLTMYDDGTHGDATADDGLYTAQYNDTVREGTYSFRFRVRGTTADGGLFERERFIQKHVSVAPSPDHLGVVIASLGISQDNVERFAVTVTPKDALGNHLGPNRAAVIKLSPTKGQLSGQLVDNLDGSYTQTLTLPTDVDVDSVDIEVAAEETRSTVSLGAYVEQPLGWPFYLILVIILLIIAFVIWRR